MIGLLLSGGMDSTALAYKYKPDIAFNVNYGQRSAHAELISSSAISDSLGIDLMEIDIDCSDLGSGDLTNKTAVNIAPESDWWPFRNQLLITLCLMKAIEVGCKCLLIGTVKSDSYHADGTAEFLHNINRLVSNQEGGIQIKAPGLNMTSVELIKDSSIPFELLAFSHSCHKANFPCANCRGCNKQYATLRELGYFDDS